MFNFVWNIMTRQPMTKECSNWHLLIAILILNGNNEHEKYFNSLLSAYSTLLELQSHTTIHSISKCLNANVRSFVCKERALDVRAVQVWVFLISAYSTLLELQSHTTIHIISKCLNANVRPFVCKDRALDVRAVQVWVFLIVLLIIHVFITI